VFAGAVCAFTLFTKEIERKRETESVKEYSCLCVGAVCASGILF